MYCRITVVAHKSMIVGDAGRQGRRAGDLSRDTAGCDSVGGREVSTRARNMSSRLFHILSRHSTGGESVHNEETTARISNSSEYGKGDGIDYFGNKNKTIYLSAGVSRIDNVNIVLDELIEFRSE